MKESRISKKRDERDSEMLPEYDFSGGIRGKYAARYSHGSNIIVLEDDVADVFPISEAVNEALRLLVELARKSVNEAVS